MGSLMPTLPKVTNAQGLWTLDFYAWASDTKAFLSTFDGKKTHIYDIGSLLYYSLQWCFFL
jgi:hypothetical protein